MALNLEKQLTFYGSYHHNPVNIAIHMIFVPTIMFTSILLGTNTPDLPLPANVSIPGYPINLGTATAALYSLLYILMEPVAGSMATPLILGGAAWGSHLTSTYGATANYWAGGLCALSWIVQFIGHGKFEGRAPALLDNLVQALFLAPFFVWLETLFFLGYRPELKMRVDKAVEGEIQKFRDSKKSTANGSANGSANGGKKRL